MSEQEIKEMIIERDGIISVRAEIANLFRGTQVPAQRKIIASIMAHINDQLYRANKALGI